MCPPAEARGNLRPTKCAIQTANGTTAALGEATVFVPGIGAAVDAIVLPQSPHLLSVGLLVQQGYEIRWGPGGCELHQPGGGVTPLKVVGGVPLLGGAPPSRAQADAGDSTELHVEVAAERSAVREGAAERHRQAGHYPWSGECSVCVECALRSKQHRRRMPHAGVLAADLVSLSSAGPHMLVGATQQPGWTYAEPVRSRAAACLRDPLLRMLLDAKRRGEVHTIHSDREAGLEALEGMLLAQGVKLSTTQGRDPQANGLAEQAVGQLCRMARAVLADYKPDVARALWQPAMVWAAQRLSDPKLPPFGAAVLARHPPHMLLGKLSARACRAIFLHRSARSDGASCVGLLSGLTVLSVATRRTVRAALAADGRWSFPDVESIKTSRRGRPPGAKAVPRVAAGRPVGEEHDGYEDALLPEDDIPWGEMVDEDDVPLGALLDAPEDDIPWSEIVDEDDVPFGAPLDTEARSNGPGQVGVPHVAAGPAHSSMATHEGEQAKRARTEVQDDDSKRARTETAGEDVAMVTKVIPMGSAEARSAGAVAAIKKELANITSKGVFDVSTVYDWAEVRQVDPEALIGSARMILGRKHAELDESQWAYKGRLVFLGNNVREASGAAVFGAPDDLFGKPVDLATVRAVLATALLRGWGVEVGDVDGAYLTAKLRGPATYMRLPESLWAAAGVARSRRDGCQYPCVKLERAIYGLPRSGFDWFAKVDDVLTSKLGWSRMPGVDSVYTKKQALLALYVDDILLAGPPKDRRREWAQLQQEITLGGSPEPLSRFLGVKQHAQDESKYRRSLTTSQDEYARRIVEKYNEVAPYPAGARMTPGLKTTPSNEGPGQRARDCRSFVGSLLYLARASRPDISCAVARLARCVSSWAAKDDKALEQLVGYIGATSGHALRSRVDVRDLRGKLWLELWVDADHAGEAGRRSTSGWVLLLCGENGTHMPIDWASRGQAVVARSSGEAETVALHEALRSIVSVNRGLCSSGIPAVDFLEKALGRPVPLRVLVDATVCKTAAEKGSSTRMRYLSKTQEVDLFWLRDVVHKVGVSLEKVSSVDNLADLLTKPLDGPRTKFLREEIGVKVSECEKRA